MSEIAERIKKVRKFLGINQANLAKELGLTQSAYSRIEIGDNNLSTEHLLKMLKNHKINPNWVLTGEGSMLLETKPYGYPIEQDQVNVVNEQGLLYATDDCGKIKKELEAAREEIIKLKGQVELLKELLSKKH